MRTVSVAEAKSHLSELLNQIEAGEEVMITRHGKAVARVVAVQTARQPVPLEHLAALRQQIPSWNGSSAEALKQLRDRE